MNTTAFGLMVAIPLLLIHTVLQSKTTEIVDSLEMASVKFLNAITERGGEQAAAADTRVALEKRHQDIHRRVALLGAGLVPAGSWAWWLLGAMILLGAFVRAFTLTSTAIGAVRAGGGVSGAAGRNAARAILSREKAA